jgi:hypothetical protein
VLLCCCCRYVEGSEKAQEYFAGYLLEQSLSIDNLFVFVLVFSYFKTPPAAQPKVRCAADGRRLCGKLHSRQQVQQMQQQSCGKLHSRQQVQQMQQQSCGKQRSRCSCTVAARQLAGYLCSRLTSSRQLVCSRWQAAMLHAARSCWRI